MSTSIEPGQVVQLKSGSPNMVVEGFESTTEKGMAKCLIWARNELRRLKIKVIALKVVDENKPNAEGDVVAIGEGQEPSNPQRSLDEDWASSGSSRPEDSGVSGGVVPATSEGGPATNDLWPSATGPEREVPPSDGTGVRF